MKYVPRGKSIAGKCDKVFIPEFPELLFMETEEVTYFDATAFCAARGCTETVSDFLVMCECFIDKLVNSYSLAENCVACFDARGNILIEGHFTYLFISFVEPNFLAYLLDRVNEMFSNGFAVSDSYIATLANSRLTKEMLTEMANGQTGA